MKSNIFVHNLRLNLDHDEDLQLHGALMNYDENNYKSKNDYLKKMASDGVFGNPDNRRRISKTAGEAEVVTMDILEQRIDKVVNDVLKELSVWFITSLASGRYTPIEKDMELKNSEFGNGNFDWDDEEDYY